MSNSRDDRRRGPRRAAWLIASIAAIVAGEGRAEAGYPNDLGCRPRIDQAEVAAIAMDPERLLRDGSVSPERLAWRIRVVASTGADGLRAIRRAIPLANEAQRISIGEGLARAAAACDERGGAVATQVAALIRAAADAVVMRAFTQYLSSGANFDGSASPVPSSAAVARLPLDGGIGDAAHYFEAPSGAELGTPNR